MFYKWLASKSLCKNNDNYCGEASSTVCLHTTLEKNQQKVFIVVLNVIYLLTHQHSYVLSLQTIQLSHKTHIQKHP